MHRKYFKFYQEICFKKQNNKCKKNDIIIWEKINVSINLIFYSILKNKYNK